MPLSARHILPVLLVWYEVLFYYSHFNLNFSARGCIFFIKNFVGLLIFVITLFIFNILSHMRVASASQCILFKICIWLTVLVLSCACYAIYGFNHKVQLACFESFRLHLKLVLWRLTLARYMNTPRVVLCFVFHTFIFSCLLSSLFLSNTL